MKTFLYLMVLLSAHAHSDSVCDPRAGRLTKCFVDVQEAVKPPCPACEQIAEDPEDPKCTDFYKKMYADGELNVTIAGGYTDLDGTRSDEVWGEYWSAQLVERLLSKCPSSYQIMDRTKDFNKGNPESYAAAQDQRSLQCGKVTSYNRACGFSRTDDMQNLTKTIYVGGKPVKVKMRIVLAPLSASDSANRATNVDFIRRKFCGDPQTLDKCVKDHTPPKISEKELVSKCGKGEEWLYQYCRTEAVKNEWYSAITRGDEIVMYEGHARNGGGPSFEPPVVLSSGALNYKGHYEKFRPGHKLETQAFKEAQAKGRAPVLYGSMSCNSKNKFITHGNLPEASPNTAIVASNRVSFTDEGVAAKLATFNGIFGGSCNLNTEIQSVSCSYGLNNL